MWRNETECGIHVTRFIASWLRSGGSLRRGNDYDDFEEWLNTIKVNGKKLSHQDVNHILDMAKCGKMELEYLAKVFLKQKQQ